MVHLHLPLVLVECFFAAKSVGVLAIPLFEHLLAVGGFAFKDFGPMSTKCICHPGGFSSNLITLFDDQLSGSAARKSPLKCPENMLLAAMVLVSWKSVPGDFQLLDAVDNGRVGELLRMVLESGEEVTADARSHDPGEFLVSAE